MKIQKPSEAEKGRFRLLVPEAPGVETKAMFGNVAAFVNGNMFMGLFGADLGLRLPPERRDSLLAHGWHPVRASRATDEGVRLSTEFDR